MLRIAFVFAVIQFCILDSAFCIENEFSPHPSPFTTPVGNPFEARMGTMVQFDSTNHLRLDIGGSAALLEPLNSDSTGWMQIGGELMTWTRLRSEGNFKFPVETVDYWFGVYGSYRFAQSPLSMRLRLAHISSHLTDGLANVDGTISPKPFVYSREFAELLFAYEAEYFKPYIGATFMWATQPDAPNPITPQAGINITYPLNDTWMVVGGYDWKLIGIDGIYAPSNAAQLGLFCRLWQGRGISFNVYAFDGRSIHGMFYAGFDSYVGLGMQIHI